jgi:hypothetical protein
MGMISAIAFTNAPRATLITSHDHQHIPSSQPLVLPLSRRQLLTATTLLPLAAPLLIKPNSPAEALPLAPLGKVEKHVGGDKLVNPKIYVMDNISSLVT